jgi:alkylation response protein AidB-like acyl-CoA dehydrogenase
MVNGTVATVSKDDLDTLRQDVRAFLADAVAAGDFAPAVDSWVREWDEDFSRQLGARGYLGMTIPQEYGGRGRTHLERFVVTEELLAAGAPVAAHWIADRQVAPALLTYGTEEQKQAYLPRIARGECYFAIGMSEPDAGSDLAGVRTKAVRVDDGYRITGSKVWTSGAHRAEAFFVLARTSWDADTPKHDGLSQFLVPLDAPGVQVRPIISADGSQHFNEVFLEDVLVPDDAVIGAIGEGWRQVTSELSYERSGPERFLSTYPLLTSALTEAGDAVDLGPALGRTVARLAALHTMSFGVASRLHQGERADVDAALVKLLGTTFEGDLVAWVSEVAEGLSTHGSTHGTPAWRPGSHARDQLGVALTQRAGFTLRGGTSEVLRGVVARGVGR